MTSKDTHKFVDSGVDEPLLPIFKGKRIKIYPGNLAKRTRFRGDRGRRRYGLRRYVFRYEGNTFVYLATRMGQRNGGFNKPLQQSSVNFTLKVPAISESSGAFNVNGIFTFAGNNEDGEAVYTQSANSRIRYNSVLTRWDWETRPETTPPAPPSGPFYTQAFSATTSNALKDSGAANKISWTYIFDPFDTAQPQVPSTAKIILNQWFNNNSVDNLNSWPIINTDMNYGKFRNQTYTWALPGGQPENRPACLSDDLLLKCFQGISLKQYDTVFVEVMWTWFELRTGNQKFWSYRNKGYEPKNSNSIHNLEWWSPAPFLTQQQKGRIYRIGILDKDNGVGKTDKILFAQRTRTVTTKFFRGGNTALE